MRPGARQPPRVEAVGSDRAAASGAGIESETRLPGPEGEGLPGCAQSPPRSFARTRDPGPTPISRLVPLLVPPTGWQTRFARGREGFCGENGRC